MKSQRQIVFVNRFYWPDEPATAQLLTDLAETLVADGWAVTILTSHPKNSERPETEVRQGVRIVRVRTTRCHKPGLLTKARAIISFSRGALKRIPQLTSPGDVLVLMTDPPLLGAWAAPSAKRRGLTVIHWLQDIYPEVAMSVTKASWLLRWLRPLRDRGWHSADACVVPGADMAAFVGSRGVDSSRILVSGNWAPSGLSPQLGDNAVALRREWGLEGKFVVAYSGNLGRVHDLVPLLHLARNLANTPDIVFLFVGSGAQRKTLEKLSTDLRLPNVQFRPAQPREKLTQSLSVGDVHLVTLRGDCVQWVFPSKLYGICAIGRPVLFVGPMDCEISRLINAHEFGFALSPSDLAGMAAALQALRTNPGQRQKMSRAAVHFHQEHGRLAQAAASWNALLSRLMPLAEGAGPDQTLHRAP